MLVWRTKDPALESTLRATFESVSEADQRRMPVHASVSGSLDTPLQLTLRAPGRPVSGAAEHIVTVCSELRLAAARGRAMTRADVAAALGPGLGGEAPLRLQDVDCGGLGQGALTFWYSHRLLQVLPRLVLSTFVLAQDCFSLPKSSRRCVDGLCRRSCQHCCTATPPMVRRFFGGL